MPLSPKIYKRPPVAGTAFYPLPGAATAENGLKCRQRRDQEVAPVQPADLIYDCGHMVENLNSPAEAAGPTLDEQKEQWAKAGYEKGVEKAEAECRQLKQEALNKLKEAELCLREARQKSRELLASSEVKMVELAVAAAEQLIKTQLELAPEKIIQIVRETMRLINGAGRLTVYVSPADLPACLELRGKLEEEFLEVNRLEILPDGALKRGSCRVESESGAAEYLLQEESCRLREMLLDIARRKEIKSAKEPIAYGSR